MTNLGSQFFDPFEDYENIEFEHHGEGWKFDEEGVHTPITHGSIHIPGRRIPVSGRWSGLQAPGAEIAEGESAPADRKWEDFRFTALSEVPDTDYEDMSSPFLNIGAMLHPNFTPERDAGSGSSVSMGVAGRPVGVDLPAWGGDRAGFYPVSPPHSTVHAEGFWLGGRRGNLDPGVGAVGPPEPGAVPYQHEEDPDFPEGERIPTNLGFSRSGTYRRHPGPGGLADMKKVERWAQDPGGEPQGPGAPEFGTHTTDWVRESDLRNYRFGARNLAARSKAVQPLDQLTSPEGVSTLSSATGDAYDYYTRELDRYMEHLRGGDDFYEQGTQGQPGLEEPEEHTETGKQILQGFEGVAAGLAAAFAPKKAPPPKQERPVIKMKDPYEAGTEGMWNRALYRSYGDQNYWSGGSELQPGQVSFKKGIVEPRHSAGKSFSSEEIEDMSDQQYRVTISDAAFEQRGLPERRMLQTKGAHAGIYGTLVEHIGDMSHRMGKPFSSQDPHSRSYNRHYPLEKLRIADNRINHPYGFEREHAEQIRENVDFQNLDLSLPENAEIAEANKLGGRPNPPPTTVEEHTQKLADAGELYSQAHEALPVYNAPMAKARDTAVHLGRQQFNDVRAGLSKIEYMLDNQKRWDALMGQGGAVRWLKSQGR